MIRLLQGNAWPLYGAAGLSMLAIVFAWPEPLASGWEWATLVAAALGVLGSMPFWQAAQADQMAQGKSGIGGLLGAIVAGVMVAVTLLHLANGVLPPGPVRTDHVTVTDKFVTRGRRGHKSYKVATTPVPGETGSRTVHRVGGLHVTSGSWNSYQIGACMMLRWREGWLWPVVVSRAAAPCPAAPVQAGPADASDSTLPPARPGPAWAGIQQRLSRDAAALPLPPQGVRVEYEIMVGSDGRITAMTALPGSPALSPIASEIVMRAVRDRPGAMAGEGRYRLWLTLRAAG